MALVELALPSAEEALSEYEGRLSVAVSNGPRSTVISGDPAALDELLATLEQAGVFFRRVKVDVASHSPQMDPLRQDLLTALRNVRPHTAGIAMRSTVTGEAVSGLELDAAYWVRNLRDPVLFSSATQRLIEDGHALFVEMSPHPILLPAIEENLRAKGQEGLALGSLRREMNERSTMLESLGALYTRGCAVEWKAVQPATGRHVALPTYPWQRERYWLEAASEPAATRGPVAAPGTHPLLGQAFAPAAYPGTYFWEQWLSAGTPAYLADHQVQGEVIFPGTGYLEMALAAATEVYGEGRFMLEDLTFERMLSLSAAAPRRVQVSILEQQEGDRTTVEIASRDEESREWIRHSRGTVCDIVDDAQEVLDPPWAVQARCPKQVDGAAHYLAMGARQIQYGPAFRGVERVWVGSNEALGRVRLPEQAGVTAAYRVHPALMDACLQVGAVLFGGDGADTLVPAGIARLRVHERLPRNVWVKATLVDTDADSGLPTVDLVVMNEEGRPLLDVTGLLVHRLARMAEPDAFAGAAFTVAWHRKELAPEGASTARPKPGLWLIFTDDGGTGAALADQLRAGGEECVEVVAGRRFEGREPWRYTINPSKLEDFQRLFRETLQGNVACLGVVHLWSLDAAPWEQTTSETLLADLRRGTMSALRLVQAIVRQGFRDAPRLVLVTRDTQTTGVEASLSAVAQAPLWGLARTIAMEQPNLGCIRVDLDPERRSDEIQALVRELSSVDGEDQIALREGKRWVARLERGDVEPADTLPLPIDAEATYLITGGLGGLGLSVASWLVSRGARHLVLVGRSAPSAGANEAIGAMKEAGAKVRAWQADVSRPGDVEDMLSQMAAQMPPLRGIIHAAAVLADRTLAEMGEEQFWQPMPAKVLGAWNLHAATLDLPLDFFVMYSSAASLLGSSGQGNYAAANAFLDALAHRRNALGLPATSIQWGPFSEVGLAAAESNRGQRLSMQGVQSFTPDEGTELLSRLLKRPRAEVGLARLSVLQMIDVYPRLVSAPFFQGLREEEARAGLAPAGSGSFRDVLMGMLRGERRAALQRKILDHVGQVLRVSAERLDAHAPFLSYGVDSLMSMEVKNRLEASLGLRLSAALLYTFPTTSTLVDHLSIELQIDFGTMDETVLVHPEDEAGDETGLSEEAELALLDKKLLDLEEYLR
jgi:acyl transferase domain-containing protein/acyl carrier protein